MVDVDQGSGIIRELRRLTQLRCLGVNKLRREDGADLCSSIEKMKYLRVLGVCSMEKEELLDLHCLSSSHQLLQRLSLFGRLDKLPDWISSLHNLSKLCLVYCRLKNDPFEALEALPNLLDLRLGDAYDGEMMCSKAGGFQKLKYLFLENFEGLKMLRVEEGAMPNISQLQIVRCGCLERVPSGLERLTNLKELFFNMPDEFRTRVCTQEEDHWKVAHIPDIRFLNWTEGRWDVHRV